MNRKQRSEIADYMASKARPIPGTAIGLHLDATITTRNRANVVDINGTVVAQFYVIRPRHGFGGARNSYRAFIGDRLIAAEETVKATLDSVADALKAAGVQS